MKKHSLLILFCFLVGPSADALSDLEMGGELDVNFSLWNLPTGQRGDSAFQVPSLFLDVEAPLKDDNVLVLRFEGSEEQKSVTTNERFTVKVREAHLDLVSIFDGLHALRVGLIPQVWQEAQYEQYGYRFLGRQAWTLTEKWNYLAPSDLGLSFMSEMPADLGEYAVTFANGEGAREKEQGPYKEASLFTRFVFSENWGVNLNYARGNYEKYQDGIKERIQAWISYQTENAGAGLELLMTQDPADAFLDYSLAEGVDVSALSGSTVRGQGASLFTTFKTGPLAELLLRYDYLNAAEGETGKDLKTALVSLSYYVNSDIRMAVMTDYTWYGEDFAPGVRDQSKIAIASQVLF